MSRPNLENVVRIVVALVILLAGVALFPFINQPVEAIGWELFAGVYSPVLAVNATSGAPGSVFAFSGSGYPPNSPATVYVNGRAVGAVMTNGSGGAAFLLNTAGAAPGQYNVTLEVDINASATQSIQLVAGGDVVTPPPGAPGETFFAGHVKFLPLIHAN
jgi:hypothetical protein